MATRSCFQDNSLAYKHLRNNVQVSPLYSTDILQNTTNTVPGKFSDNEDNTLTITNNDDDNNDSIMINIDDDTFLEESVENLNNNERHHTVVEKTAKPLSHRELSAMANNRFQTIWRLLTGQHQLQQSFIASIDTFVERARMKEPLCIETWCVYITQVVGKSFIFLPRQKFPLYKILSSK